MSQRCWEIIRRALDNPVEGTTIILEDEKFDKRGSHVKSVVQSAYSIEFPKIYDDQMREWLQWYAERLNIHLSADAAAVLKESCEPKMRHLINELEKIRLFITDVLNFIKYFWNVLHCNSLCISIVIFLPDRTGTSLFTFTFHRKSQQK